jgi:hypothetical protein
MLAFTSLPVSLLLALSSVSAQARQATDTEQAPPPPRVTLVGFAALPAKTFAEGPVSGQFAKSANGLTVPFASQPVQGVSAILLLGGSRRDTYALADNGYGAKSNSADFILRFYHLTPEYHTVLGGRGNVAVNDFVSLSDPDRKIGFPIVADSTLYPNAKIPVADIIRQRRLLTGADLDIESFRRLPDGTFWFGDEFGPFLVHTDARGKLLDAPVPVPNLLHFGANPLIQSPSNPLLGTAKPNLPDSGGFEGMALSSDNRFLYCLLEKSVEGDPDPRRLLLLPFDLKSRQFDSRPLFYRKETATNSICDLTAVNESELLVIERDNEQGEKAAFKRVYLLDISETDTDGYVKKTLIADLLRIEDPRNVSGYARSGVFRFPFITIEAVAVWDKRTLLIANDNNLPGSSGRTPGKPDDNEFILIRLPEALRLTPPQTSFRP